MDLSDLSWVKVELEKSRANLTTTREAVEAYRTALNNPHCGPELREACLKLVQAAARDEWGEGTTIHFEDHVLVVEHLDGRCARFTILELKRPNDAA